MTIVICPGIHDPALTQSFIAQLRAARFPEPARLERLEQPLIFPTQTSLAYSPVHVLEFLQRHCSIQSALILICFSAGVVGGIGAAWPWQQAGGKIQAFLALDGWGVPLYGDFPIYRISHDYFTYWSSQLLGAGVESFYADPAVEHLDLWRSPYTTQGWWVQAGQRQRTDAATLINLLLERYGESG